MSHVARLGPLVALLGLGLVGLPGARAGAAQGCDHPISAPGVRTVGLTIHQPGVYCLMTDVLMAPSFTSGPAITINANFVTLDLNGYKVAAVGAGAGSTTQAQGIRAVGRRVVTVKNGTVWGFHTGIELSASSAQTRTGYLVEGVRVESNTVIGIDVRGADSIVRNSVVAQTGPSGLPGGTNAYGIRVNSDGGRILQNEVLTVTGTFRPFVGPGVGFGIHVVGSDVLVVGNRITGAGVGVAVDPFTPGATAKCRDNLTAAVTTPFWGGCVDAGGND